MGKIFVTLEVSDKGTAVVRQMGRDTTQAFDKMKAKAREAGAGMSGSLQKLKQNWLAVTAAAAGAIAVMRQCVKGFMEQEAAEMKLAVAMRNRGDYTRESFREMRAYAAQLQKMTTYGDELTISMMANLKSYGMNNEELKKATKATMDLAKAKGMDLVAAADLVGKAFVGETGTLSRYGIVIEKGLEKSEKFEAVLKLINARFGGQAQADIMTYSGQLKQMSNWWGDIKEKVGLGLLKALEAVQFALGMATAGFYTLLEAATGGLAKLINLGSKLPIVGGGFKALAEELDFVSGNFGRAKDKATEFASKNYDMLVACNKTEDAIESMGNMSWGVARDMEEAAEDEVNSTKEALEAEWKMAQEHSDLMQQLRGDDLLLDIQIRDAKLEAAQKGFDEKIRLDGEAERADLLFAGNRMETADMVAEHNIAKAKETAAKEKELLEEKKRLRKLVLNDMLTNLSAFFLTMGAKSKAAFLAYQAVEVTKAVMSTISAAQEAYKWGMAVGGPALAVASAAAAVAAGYARVREIAAMKPESATTTTSTEGGGVSPVPALTTTTPTAETTAGGGTSRSITLNVNVYGNVVDHDRFARELIPSIQKAVADGA